MKLTPDIQIIRPAQKDKLSVSSGPPPVINKASIDTGDSPRPQVAGNFLM
jgi:hypothetical protein